MRPALAAMMVTGLVIGCTHRAALPPPAGPDQSVHDAMVLVCAAPDRAAGEHGMSKSDAIAAHLTDGIGNTKVLTAADAWKTDGINAKQLDALVKEAKLTRCALRDETIGS